MSKIKDREGISYWKYCSKCKPIAENDDKIRQEENWKLRLAERELEKRSNPQELRKLLDQILANTEKLLELRDQNE
jgi:hypothetical protein